MIALYDRGRAFALKGICAYVSNLQKRKKTRNAVFFINPNINTMHCKRNNFHWVPILFTLFWACQTDKKHDEATTPLEPQDQTPPLIAIANGNAVLSDSTVIAIPHYNDTAYTIFYCVRHTEKRKDQGDNPDLTAEGEARAERLGVILKDEPLDRAFSTNFKRTVRTAELIRKHSAKIPPASAYPPSIQGAWLDETLETGKGKHFLVVGHSNTVPQLLNLLKGDSTYQNIPDGDYSRFYIAISKGVGQSEIMDLHY